MKQVRSAPESGQLATRCNVFMCFFPHFLARATIKLMMLRSDPFNARLSAVILRHLIRKYLLYSMTIEGVTERNVLARVGNFKRPKPTVPVVLAPQYEEKGCRFFFDLFPHFFKPFHPAAEKLPFFVKTGLVKVPGILERSLPVVYRNFKNASLALHQVIDRHLFQGTVSCKPVQSRSWYLGVRYNLDKHDIRVLERELLRKGRNNCSGDLPRCLAIDAQLPGPAFSCERQPNNSCPLVSRG
jgi:hypothetical protein